MRSRRQLLVFLVVMLAGFGCASKKQSTYSSSMAPPPSSGDNVVISKMQGAGRSIVNGTKKGYESARSGLQKWIDPSASETASAGDKAGKGLDDVDRQASTGPKTVVRGHTSDESDGPSRVAQGSDDRKSTTRVGSRPVGTTVADSFVIE